mgnify:CR=1 FL=1
MVELIILKPEEKVSETIEELELELFSALESLVKKESHKDDSQKSLIPAEISLSELFAEDFKDSDSESLEYLKSKHTQQTFDYDYSSDKLGSFYDSVNEQESEIKEEVLDEIKAQKIANTWNIPRQEQNNSSLAKKAAQELYKTINFTMNTILYDLAEA